MAAGFVLTPHKLSMCVLLQLYAAPPALTPPFPLPAAVRHQLALFLLGLAKACDGFLEPTLEDLGMQLKECLGSIGEVIAEQLASRLLGFSSPEDLFTFVVLGLREIVVPAPYTVPERGGGNEDSLLVEHNSPLGQFLRRCILSFNILSFEGTCRLLAELDAYRRPALSIGDGNIVAKDSLSCQQAEGDDDEDEEEDRLEDDEDENVIASVTPVHGRERHGNGRRAFGVPLIPTEGSEELELQEFTDMQELEGFGANHVGNGGGVRDGGFAFAFGDAASRGEHATQGSFLRTYGQVEAFMKDQAILIAKELGTTNKVDLDTKLNLIENLAPEMHRVHYLQYLNSIHHGDYPAAMSRLHQYFDYSAGRGNIAPGIDASVGRFQAGLLTLGSMHAHFGHVTQALQALSETVRIAQQNNDDACLAHSLAALCHLLSEVGVAAEVTKAGAIGDFDRSIGPQLAAQQHLLLSLKRCLKRALELKLPNLVAFSRLALAKFDLQHVRRLPLIGGLRSSEQLGTSPVDVCKTLRISPYLLGDLVHSMSSSGSQRITSGAFGQAPGMPGNTQTGRLGPLSESLLKLAGSSYLLRSCSWELYGSDPMMRASTLVHAYCYSKSASADDLSVAYVKLAHHLAAHKGYRVALTALEQAMKKFPLHARSSLRSVQLQFIHSQAINRGNTRLAWVACSELAAMASPVLGVDMELKFEASYRHALTLLACKNYSEAATSAGELFALCYKYDMQLHVVKVLLLIAEIHKKSGSAVTGLPYVLGSITLSQSLNLDLLHAASRVSLAELWLDLGADHAQRALDLLQQSLPLVLGHGSLELRARTNLCIARCYLSSTDFSVATAPELVLDPLQLAAEEFMNLEDKDQASEAFYLLATTFNSIGRMEDRDKAAEKFQQCVVEEL
ncbi:anaphase-promoting complex subunit 5 isoform X1 [Selaginella moellendorffii]|uniref:anaphase-promoting complex subunit 5 isoform X1 n=1 Tax=Selaginella moellendorffii TaxID=88036 RepID=UPI000D1C9967|nr:anaphase-promoting complex subunit 5 isoform X1 [Selaginella moellendorffii]|eukprot:XP_024536915.1 anaphase-promoting complex subunit 5 isoform X1 [Selaginella moellendorffii]